MLTLFSSFLDKRCGDCKSQSESAKFYLSARAIASLWVLPVLFSHFAGRLLSQSFVFPPDSTRETSILYSDSADRKSSARDGSLIDVSSIQSIFAHEKVRESDIGYGSNSRTYASTTETNAIFYESLVHFPMLCHDNPERVAVVVDGVENDEEAVLSEVLKHTTVKQVDIFGVKTSTSEFDLRDPRAFRVCSSPADSISEALLQRATEVHTAYDVFVWNNRR
jgi:hypothetical protein